MAILVSASACATDAPPDSGLDAGIDAASISDATLTDAELGPLTVCGTHRTNQLIGEECSLIMPVGESPFYGSCVPDTRRPGQTTCTEIFLEQGSERIGVPMAATSGCDFVWCNEIMPTTM